MNTVKAYPRSRGGFSLLELIVVLGIMAVVTTLGTSAFISMSEWWAQTRTATELEREAERAFTALRRDFHQIIPHEVSGVAIASTTAIHDSDPRFYRVGLADDTLTVPVYVPIGDDGRVVAGRVRYSIERAELNYTLVRHVAALDGEFSGEGQEVARNVAGLSIQFPTADGKFWSGTWDGAGPPPLVRINVLLLDSSRASEQIARALVMPVYVD